MTKPAKTAKDIRMPSFSVVVETENLGMAKIDDLAARLYTIIKQGFPIKNAEEVLLIVGGNLSKISRDLIEKNYPWVTIYESKGHLGYTTSKLRGAEIAKGDVVVSADSDVLYENLWLGNILGGLISLLNRDYIVKKITAREQEHIA